MSNPIDPALNNCQCCEPDPAPSPIYNRPGLPSLSYRAGSYSTFFRHMLAQLGNFTLQDGDFAGARPLTVLTTRESDDPSIALLDASAIVADVLTFYQERIANEGFLRTADERRSILEMARSIGYELSPGVAATAYLAFTVEDAEGAPGMADIPINTRVQSIPPQGKLPQSFETSTALTAYKEWNAIQPRFTFPQTVTTSAQRIYLKGVDANLRAGDRLLVDSGSNQAMLRIMAIKAQPDQKRTQVDFDASPSLPGYVSASLPQGQVDITTQIPLDGSAITTNILCKQWTDDDMNAFLSFNKWDKKELLTYLENERKTNASATGSVHALRMKLPVFGNNAPLYGSLPNINSAAYPGQNWDSAWPIWKYQMNGNYYQSADLYLERVVDGLLPDSWICLDAVGTTPRIYKIASQIEYALAAFAMSGKASGLTLKTPAGASLNDNDTDKPSKFDIRTTTVHLQSEKLTLAELPFGEDLGSDPAKLELNDLVLGFHVGQSVTLRGERSDMSGVLASEVLTIKTINHIGGFTVLTFESGRKYTYLRSKLTLNANTVSAIHGETVNEILGSGDGAKTNQRFTLKKPPLTYIPATTPTGSASTLKLRVNGLLWNESTSLYDLDANDQEYVIRIDDDPTAGSGKTAKATVIFGDGEVGARLPTGQNNVSAVYRSGIGLDGQVDAGILTLLPSKPLGVRGVINPLAAKGAGDPEKMDDARDNAPLTVRTLDRIVSLYDYEDFSRAYAGIGKAQAIDLWNGEQHLVHITIAGADGKPVTDEKFIKTFKGAMDKVRDPVQQVKVDTFDLLLFNLTANLAVDNRYVTEAVFDDVQDALEDAFSFQMRRFGQDVTAAEVITVIQNVEGVIYVDLDSLYLSSTTESPNQILGVGSAYVNSGTLQRAQLLLLNTLGVDLQEVQS
ncbi:MAG: putative baseplate assembly protein [Anaerolineaceae bacterium]|nr:putative baseplate assembly protein [Anaerolineaceae bacterium]